MKKGNFGFYVWVYPVVGLFAAVLSEMIPCILIAGFAIAAEKNEWVTKQVLQAVFLCIASKALRYLPTAFISVIAGSGFEGGVVMAMFCIFNAVVVVGSTVLAGIGAVNAVRGRNAGVPGFSRIADFLFVQSGVNLYFKK